MSNPFILITHIQIIFSIKRILSWLSKYIEIEPSLFSKRDLASNDTPYCWPAHSVGPGYDQRDRNSLLHHNRGQLCEGDGWREEEWPGWQCQDWGLQLHQPAGDHEGGHDPEKNSRSTVWLDSCEHPVNGVYILLLVKSTAAQCWVLEVSRCTLLSSLLHSLHSLYIIK